MVSRILTPLLGTAALIGALVAVVLRVPVPDERRGATVSGRVVYAITGRPAVGVAVLARPATGQSGEVGPAAAKADRHPISSSTDAKGRFTLGPLSAGGYTVEIEHPRLFGAYGQLRPGASAETVVVGAETEGKPVDVLVPVWPGAAIGGRVRGTDDRPWPDAEVRILPAGRETSWTNVRTDAAGRYQAVRLWPGDYRVVVPVFQMSSGARPSGQRPAYTGITTFAGNSVEAGSARRIELGLGEHRPDVDVHVQSVLSARLTLAIEAEPVPGTFFRLRLWRSSDLDRLELPDARVDLPEPGQVVLDDLPRASYTLEVERLVESTQAVAYWPVRVRVDLRNGNAAERVFFGEDAPLDTTVEVEATLARQITGVSGIVRDPLNPSHRLADPTDVAVLAFPIARERWVDAGLGPDRLASQRLDETGSFAIVGLPAGEYFVTAVPLERLDEWPLPYMLAWLARTADRVELRPGERRQLDLELR